MGHGDSEAGRYYAQHAVAIPPQIFDLVVEISISNIGERTLNAAPLMLPLQEAYQMIRVLVSRTLLRKTIRKSEYQKEEYQVARISGPKYDSSASILIFWYSDAHCLIL